MTTKEQFVAEARTWIDTPFHHEGRVKGAGVDCVGVAVGSAIALGIPVQDVKNYPKVPSDGMFSRVINSHTDPVSIQDVRVGDIMKFRFMGAEQHLAIVSQIYPYIMIIHAFAQVGKCVENILDDYWKERLTEVRRIRSLT